MGYFTIVLGIGLVAYIVYRTYSLYMDREG